MNSASRSSPMPPSTPSAGATRPSPRWCRFFSSVMPRLMRTRTAANLRPTVKCSARSTSATSREEQNAMFNQERVKTARISLVESRADDGKAAETVETPGIQSPVAKASTVPEPVTQGSEIGTLKMRPLLDRVTRDQVVSALFSLVSIGALFLFWYLGTKYKIEFYIRFRNVPTPYEVFRQAVEVGSSTKFLVNVLYSVRRPDDALAGLRAGEHEISNVQEVQEGFIDVRGRGVVFGEGVNEVNALE